MRTICVCLFAITLSTACTTGRDPMAPSSDTAAQRSAERSWDRNAACGDVIVADLRLGNDLICAGDALIVGADGIKINLDGHTIMGSGAGVGITVRGRQDIWIFGGTVTDFVTGVFIATSTGVVVKDNGFTRNREAVFLNGSSGNIVKANVAWQNGLRGIMLRPTASGAISTDNEVVDNILRDNPSGILVFGQPGNTLKANTISGASIAAIDLTGGGATGNVIKGNLLMTSAAGIRFGAGWTGNTILGNTIQANLCGFQGPSAGNTLQGNSLAGNSSDFCP
jgi:parallel beta-helix repeat protein